MLIERGRFGEDMNCRQNLAAAIPSSMSDRRWQSGGRIVAVGDLAAWRDAGHDRFLTPGVLFAAFHDITADFLAEAAPLLVVSPLVARQFDCVDLAEVLHRLGYTGCYRAIDMGLPRPEMIVAEIRALAPGLDFGLTRMTSG